MSVEAAAQLRASCTEQEQAIIQLITAADGGDEAAIDALMHVATSADAARDSKVFINQPYPLPSHTGFNMGATALMYASRSGHVALVEKLLAILEASSTQLQMEGDTSTTSTSTTFITLVNAVDAENWNALHYACFNGHAAIAKKLLQVGCDPALITTFEKATPLQFVSHRRFLDVVKVFVEYNNESSALEPSVVQAALVEAETAYTPEERKKMLTRGIDKYHRGKRSGALFLFRYDIGAANEQKLLTFLQDEMAGSVAGSSLLSMEKVHDALTNTTVTIHMATSRVALDAFLLSVAANYQHDGKTSSSSSSSAAQQLVRVSAVSGLQHFAVFRAA